MSDQVQAQSKGFYVAFPEGAAVVIGGSGGIGRAVCIKLAECGCDVAFTYQKNLAAAQETAQRIQALGQRAYFQQLDLADETAAQAFYAKAQGEFSRLHSLIVATGADIRMSYLADVEVEEMRQTILNDVVGFFIAVKFMIPHLRTGGGGSIVGLSSAAIVRHAPLDILSSGPKGSVESMVRAIAREEGRSNIRANCVALGVIDAGLMDRVWEQLPSKTAETWRTGTPLRRIGTAEEAAEAIVFLASSRSSFTTGQRLVLDGGYST